MNTPVRLSLGFLGLMLPALALAAPGNVSGIRAEKTAEGVQVSWNAPSGDIASYRVYYSTSSILNNGGLYDDFETTDSNQLFHVLRNIPAASDLYVSVLAVDAKGSESPYFLEEAHVVLDGQMVSSTPSMPASSSADAISSAMAASSAATMPQSDELRLLSAEAVSATGVLLTFSLPVTVDPGQAADAIMMTTGSGVRLQMRRFIVTERQILVHTEMQERGTVYQIDIGAGVSAQGSKGQRLSVPADEAPLLFSGHVTGTEVSSASSTSSVTIVRGDVTTLRLRAQPEGNTYRVDITWQPPTGTSFTGYSVAQTTDGGKTYAPARKIDTAATGLTIRSVPAGSFGVVVRTTYADNSVSRGVLQTIHLAQIGGTSGSVTGGSGALPNSGPALWVAVLGLSCAAGYMQVRRARLKRAVA